MELSESLTQMSLAKRRCAFAWLNAVPMTKPHEVEPRAALL